MFLTLLNYGRFMDGNLMQAPHQERLANWHVSQEHSKFEHFTVCCLLKHKIFGVNTCHYYHLFFSAGSTATIKATGLHIVTISTHKKKIVGLPTWCSTRVAQAAGKCDSSFKHVAESIKDAQPVAIIWLDK